MSFPTQSAARRALQAATMPAHERLHANAMFAALLRGDMTRPAYRRLLLRLLGLHEPIETSLDRLSADPLLAWRGTSLGISRTARLRADLAALGVGQPEIDAAPRAQALLPPLADPASALGCAWVVEGSALGGRVMSAKIKGTLQLTREAEGHAFFSADPGQPARWRGCCEALEACSARPDGLPAMVRAATATFAAFETWLDVPPHRAP
jgi:heme oxygenase (biliverdin-IX-beta and delta-forming)